MIFHRLVTPAYIGGLPAGYDILNNPAANGQSGVPAPADSSFLALATNPNQGTYFVGFGEDGRAFAANRGLYALGLNTDFIDNFLHEDFAVLASASFSVGAPTVITGTSTNPVFVGVAGTTNNQAGLEPYFHVTDQNNNDIVDPSSNNQVVVTAASGGVGTFFVGALTLTLNVAPTVPYRVWYGTRSSLLEMTRDNFVRSSVWGVAHTPASLIQFQNNLNSIVLSKGASLVGMNTTGFTGDTLTFLGGAGLKTAGVATVRDAFIDVDAALNRRRAYAGVITDGTTSAGGDFDGATLDPVFLSFGGTFFVRAGLYSIGNSAPSSTNNLYDFVSDITGATFTLTPGRSQDLTFDGTFNLSDVGLTSLSTAKKRFVAMPQGLSTGTKIIRGGFQAGAFLVENAGGGYIVLEDTGAFDPVLGSTNAAFEASGECRVAIRRCLFEFANNSLNTYLHDFVDDTASSILIEDSYFATFETDVDVLRLLNVKVPITFRNCVFEVLVTTGTGYPIRLINNNDLVSFENCRFRSANGQVFWSAGTKLNLDHCILESTDDAPGAATGQMVMVNGSGTLNTLTTLRGNTIVVGSSSMRGNSGTIQRAVVELGGTNNVANPDCPMDVDGLEILLSADNTVAHNFTMVLLHGGTSIAGAPGSSVRRYKGVNVRLTGLVSDGTGTTGGVYRTSVAYPTYVTVGGGDTRHSTIVEDLHIVDVMNPSVDHNRQVFFCDKATLRNPVFDASNISAAGKYTRDPIEIWESEVYGISLERQFGFKTNQSHLLISKTVRIHSGELIGHVITEPFSWIQYGDAHCDIDNFSVHFASVIVTSAAAIFSCPQQCCSLTRSRVFIDGDWGGRIVNFSAGSDLARVEDNFLFWRRGAAQILLSTGAGSKVADNNMASTVAAPTYTVSGANSSDNDNSAFLQSGSVANPV